MKTLRDNQRSRLYAAERAAFDYAKTAPDFKTLDECEEFLNKFISGKVFQRHFPYVKHWKIVLRSGRGSRTALADRRVIDGVECHCITLPKWSRRKSVILHELAHHINDAENRDVPYAAHGWQYAEIFLDLVRRGIGVEAQKALKNEFKARKVYTWEKKRSAHTEEHRQMLSERMKRINEAKKALRGG